MDLTWAAWSRGIYPHGAVCGFLMAVWAFWARNWDIPAPLIAIFLFLPYGIVSGLMTARRHGVDAGMLAGSATVMTGHVVVFSAAVLYTALRDPWPDAVFWAVAGALLIGLIGILGCFFGWFGGLLARAVWSVPS
jgi:FtsH-binding integral membrane protein